MQNMWKRGWLVVLPLALGVVIGSRMWPTAQAGSASAPVAEGSSYTVVSTEGHNLIVTNNKNNSVYFYTIDKDKEVGSTLKLRGTIDLNDVGKPELSPKSAGK